MYSTCRGMVAFQVCVHYACVTKGCGDLKAKIKASICANKKLYEDILLYKVGEHIGLGLSRSIATISMCDLCVVLYSLWSCR